MNVGKSSLFNALAGQSLSIVDGTPGTTTDPVRKILEIEGLGPVVLIDTGGIDDKNSQLGRRRIKRTIDIIDQIDLAVLMFSHNIFADYEQSLMTTFLYKKIPFFLIHGKNGMEPLKVEITGAETVTFSLENPNKQKILDLIKKNLKKISSAPKSLLEGMAGEGDAVLLVTPIDAAAPEGRMILPQVQTLRAALDKNIIVTCVQPAQLKAALEQNKNFALVITDSQAFAEVAKIVPANIPLTSFSMLLARMHENFRDMVKGVRRIDNLQNDDKVLILESCTHTINNCVDIGRVKLPALIQKFTGKKLDFTVIAGLDALPEDLSSYALAVQCGGCMATETQLKNRLNNALEAGVPVTNYGMAIAYCSGIFDRVLKPLL
jgi:[FeFe] hydrogenase H-cluster maturation GTPase HydF